MRACIAACHITVPQISLVPLTPHFALVSFRFISFSFHSISSPSHLISFHSISCTAIRVTMRENVRGKRTFSRSRVFFPLSQRFLFAERGATTGRRKGGKVLDFTPVVNNTFTVASSKEGCLPFPYTPPMRHDRVAPRHNLFVSEMS